MNADWDEIEKQMKEEERRKYDNPYSDFEDELLDNDFVNVRDL